MHVGDHLNSERFNVHEECSRCEQFRIIGAGRMGACGTISFPGTQLVSALHVQELCRSSVGALELIARASSATNSVSSISLAVVALQHDVGLMGGRKMQADSIANETSQNVQSTGSLLLHSFR